MACNHSDDRQLSAVPPVPPSARLEHHETIPPETPVWVVPACQRIVSYSSNNVRHPGTDVPVARITAREDGFRHGGWAGRRRQVLQALQKACISQKRLARFVGCGGSVHVRWSESERKYACSGNYCRDRFCIPCGTARGSLIADNLIELCQGKTVRFLTLTLRSRGSTLATCIDRLMLYFGMLREGRLWKRHVKGGAYFIEVKRGKGSGGWHVHVHCLVEGHFLPKQELSDAWRTITGDSYIVDIRPVPDIRAKAQYVTKYVSKPMDTTVFASDADLAECIVTLHGRRLCGCFQSWRGTELERRPEQPTDWIDIGPLDAILRLAGQEHAAAAAVIAAIRPGYGEHAPAELTPKSLAGGA